MNVVLTQGVLMINYQLLLVYISAFANMVCSPGFIVEDSELIDILDQMESVIKIMQDDLLDKIVSTREAIK